MSGAAYDPKEVFTHALRFHVSINALVNSIRKPWIKDTPAEGRAIEYEGGGTMPPTMVVSFVCEAFCIELYLKTILYLENITPPRKHAFDELFAKVPASWQSKIQARYEQELKQPIWDRFRSGNNFPSDLPALLKEAANAFEQWRYVFEEFPCGHFLSPLRSALLWVILTERPDWLDLWRNRNTPPMPQAASFPTHHGAPK